MLWTRRNNSDDRSDEDLYVDFSVHHNMDSIGVLYKRYTHLVLGVCMKYLENEEAAKDAVMQIFENLIKKPEKSEIKSFKNWLFIVTRNHCLMQLRLAKSENRAKEQKLAELQGEIMEISEPLHLMDEAEEEVKIRKLHQSLEKLGLEQRKCIELFYLEDKSYHEIVTLTGYDVNKVKSYIQNGKRNLKIMLGNENER